ncbi:MAG: glutamyl-tRNA reductase [Actinomycetia bacterium]|nr:glutamyl-tRNA reductase [Actinomycetes bacterium]MCP3913461.1 glutamyl-tRNA reductase [Actinomycetes bacterium]MCP4086046.1 glutamyl-tRNA reductase [Actinomycetes bacterium]
MAIGLNNHSVPLELFEQLTVDPVGLPKVLTELVGHDHVSEAVVLSTCNRTEIYIHAVRFHGAYQDVRTTLAEMAGVDADDFTDHLYVHYEQQAVEHLFRVAAGLESAVLGEHEILGQLRTSWERSQGEGAVGPTLNLLFRKAIEVGKRARTETSIARHTASVSHAAVEMARDHLGGLVDKKVLILGAGEMADGMGVALGGAGASEIMVANRTPARAEELAERVAGRAVPLAELDAHVADVDVLLTSTGARSLIVGADELAGPMAQRPHRPLLVVDIAIPRDIDPGVAELDGVTLFDMDDLRRFAEAGQAERRGEVGAVEQIIAVELERHQAEVTARQLAPLITGMRESFDAVRRTELDRQWTKLGDLSPEQIEAVEAITRGVVNKLLHQPSVRLKDAAGTPQGERLAEAVRELFDF